MKSNIKKCMVIATSFVIIGLILFASIMFTYGWDFTKLNTVSLVTTEHFIGDEFHSIDIDVDTSDIVICKSDSDQCKVICYEKENEKHSVSVENNVLKISLDSKRQWHDYLQICFSSPKITVYLPEYIYDSLEIDSDIGDIEVQDNFDFNKLNVLTRTGSVFNYSSASEMTIDVNTGDITLKNIDTMSLDVSVSTGDINLHSVDCDGDIVASSGTGDLNFSSVSCRNLISDTGTGDVYIKNLLAAINIRVETNTGDVVLSECDAEELYIETNTGDVDCILLSDKMYVAHSNTGSVNVPGFSVGGRCEVKVNTGDINIKVV